MYPYIENHLKQDGKLAYITRHMLGLFNGLPGSRQFRRHLSEQAYKNTADIQTIEDALACMPDNPATTSELSCPKLLTTYIWTSQSQVVI